MEVHVCSNDGRREIWCKLNDDAAVRLAYFAVEHDADNT